MFISVVAKMLFFAGFAVGTFGAGLISDRYGRKSAIVLMAQLLFGCGILTATMSNVVGFTIMWFFTGNTCCWKLHPNTYDIIFVHVPDLLIFILHHSLLGIAAMGTYTVCFVWAMESVSGRYKTFISTFMNFGWPIGR